MYFNPWILTGFLFVLCIVIFLDSLEYYTGQNLKTLLHKLHVKCWYFFHYKNRINKKTYSYNQYCIKGILCTKKEFDKYQNFKKTKIKTKTKNTTPFSCKQGDKIKCIKATSLSLTKGKIYKVMENTIESHYVYITNDKGYILCYNKKYFKLLNKTSYKNK